MNEEINAGMGPEKPKGHIRGIWAITIIVVIAILVGGGVWYWYYKTNVNNITGVNTTKISPSTSPTPSGSASASPSSTSDETANWKTYSDTTNGFSFKYPPKWTDKINNLTKSIVTIYSNNEYGPPVEPVIYILDVTKENSLPQTQYSTSSLNNYSVYVSKDEPSRSGLTKYYFKKNNNEYIALAFAPYDEQTPFEGQNTEYPYFQKILNTFKFL